MAMANFLSRFKDEASRFQLVTGPVFRIKCRRCKKNMWAGDGGAEVYADIKGVPFKDYYCRQFKAKGPMKSRKR